MKKLILLLPILISVATFGQATKQENKPLSKIEAISEKSGELQKKEYQDLGKVAGVKFQVLTITNIVNNTQVRGLRMEYTGYGTYASTIIAFLDADEFDGLIKTFDYCLTTVVTAAPPDNDVEYNFRSRDGFSAGAFNYKGKWRGYVKLEQYDSRSQSDFDVDDMKKIKDLLEVAKSKL